MNEKEARKIVNTKSGLEYWQNSGGRIEMARGYLEAIEKAKELVEALEHTSKELTRHKFYKAQGRLLTKVDDALVQWKAEK